MTTIPRAYVDNFTRVINGISDDAQKKLAKALEGVVIDDIAAARNEIIAIMDTLLAPYTDNVAAVAATFYDGLRAYFGIDDGFMAESESMREPAATAGAVRAFMQTQVDGKPFGVLENLLTERVDYECKRAANECIAYNAKNDPKRPKWARIPTGAETCMWCIMLASRGFAYLSEEAASHTHANCDCRVIPSWDKDNPAVQGYDPDLYYDMWKNPEKYKQEREEVASANAESEQKATNRQEIKEAVEYYASGEGMYINQFIRRGEYSSLSDDEKELVRLLDEATQLDVIDVPKLYRSVDASSVFGAMSVGDYESLAEGYVYDDDYAKKKTRAIIERAKPGKVITEKGFMSTSEDYDVVSEWYDFTGSDKAITLELSVPDGTRGCKVYKLTPEVEERDPQREVLLPRDTKYQITEITTRDGLIYVKAKIIK